MSSMPREVPSWGDSGRDEVRAGDRTREGSADVEGERVEDVLADKGLRYLQLAPLSHDVGIVQPSSIVNPTSLRYWECLI